MGRMNLGRVILGGLLAGLIINIGETVLNLVVIASEQDEWLKSRNMPPIANSSIGVWVVLSFILGIFAVWIYAAIRPRFGPGVGTAIKAGLVTFFLANCYLTLGLTGMGLFPTNLTLVTLAWALVEVLVATVAGAWAYTEA